MPESAIEARRAKYLAERDALTRKQNEADKLREKSKPYSDSPRDAGKSILKGPTNSPLPLHATKVEYYKFMSPSRGELINLTGRPFNPTPANKLQFDPGPIKEWSNAKEAIANLLRKDTGSKSAIELLVLLHRSLPHEHLYPPRDLKKIRIDLKKRGLLAKGTTPSLTETGKLVARALDSFAKEEIRKDEPMLPFLLQTGLVSKNEGKLEVEPAGAIIHMILKARYLDYHSAKSSSPGQFNPDRDVPLHNAAQIITKPTLAAHQFGVGKATVLAYAGDVFKAKGKTIPARLVELRAENPLNPKPERKPAKPNLRRTRRTIPYGVINQRRTTPLEPVRNSEIEPVKNIAAKSPSRFSGTLRRITSILTSIIPTRKRTT